MAERPFASRLWYEFLRRVLQLAAVLLYRVRHTGYHNIPRTGGVLVVSNHQSVMDPPLVGMGCPRRMNYLARETLFRFGPFRWLITSLDAIPIDREGVKLAGIKESLKRLKRGEMVLMFPEGTRTSDGEIHPFRPGFCALAQRSGAAILPVAVEGAFQAWPRGRRLPRLGMVHVHYGEPLLPEHFAGWDELRLVAEVEKRVRRCQAILRSRPVVAGLARARRPDGKSFSQDPNAGVEK